MTPKNEAASGSKFLKYLISSKRDLGNEIRFAAWTILWALGYYSASVILSQSDVSQPLSWGLVAVPIIMALPVIRAYHRFILNADEMVRKIQLESIGIGFAAGLVFSFMRDILASNGVPAADTGDVGAIMLAAWGLAQLYGAWKYR